MRGAAWRADWQQMEAARSSASALDEPVDLGKYMSGPPLAGDPALQRLSWLQREAEKLAERNRVEAQLKGVGKMTESKRANIMLLHNGRGRVCVLEHPRGTVLRKDMAGQFYLETDTSESAEPDPMVAGPDHFVDMSGDPRSPGPEPDPAPIDRYVHRVGEAAAAAAGIDFDVSAGWAIAGITISPGGRFLTARLRKL